MDEFDYGYRDATRSRTGDFWWVFCRCCGETYRSDQPHVCDETRIFVYQNKPEYAKGPHK